MDDPAKKAAARLSKVWTHTLSVFALFAAAVTIVSFFGFHPSGGNSGSPRQTVTPGEGNKADAKADTSHSALAGESLAASSDSSGKDSAAKPPRLRGVGTVHLDGGFAPGQAMLTNAALTGQADPVAAVVLRNSKTLRGETLSAVRVPVDVQGDRLVSYWRKGTRFVHGIRLTSDAPHIRLIGPGLPSVDLPTDESGGLVQNLLWPADKMFTSVEYVGPVSISGLPLAGGLSFGDPNNLESGRALPTSFSLDIPKPGEILGAIKGDFSYPGRSEQPRFIVIQVQAAAKDRPVTWSAAIDASGPTQIRDSRDDVVVGLYSLKVLYSTESK